ncbi:MAG: sigma-70 family RNA polymerase sigma factor [Oscillospiraceae bacterium]|nr:sigma-70 family RNA polymerase sigma factor [Oscillospiraceae bacterium]
MTTINLRNYYPWYKHDEYIEVPDEVAAELKTDKLYEASYQRQLMRNKAHYSLDCDDGIEYTACLANPTPQELIERMEMFYYLWNALNSLPETQGRRVDACIILGASYREQARIEGVGKSSIRMSVLYGLENMRKYLKNYL